MGFKFEGLEIWKLSLEYLDLVYEIAALLPKSEEYNLKSPIIRAGTSISLAIAEGSTGQTDAEQSRFLGIAVRSLFETVACQHLIARRKYLESNALLRHPYDRATTLAKKITAMRKNLDPDRKWVRESGVEYLADEPNPFMDEGG